MTAQYLSSGWPGAWPVQRVERPRQVAVWTAEPAASLPTLLLSPTWESCRGTFPSCRSWNPPFLKHTRTNGISSKVGSSRMYSRSCVFNQQPGVKLGGCHQIWDPAPFVWDPLPLKNRSCTSQLRSGTYLLGSTTLHSSYLSIFLNAWCFVKKCSPSRPFCHLHLSVLGVDRCCSYPRWYTCEQSTATRPGLARLSLWIFFLHLLCRRAFWM